MTGFVWFLAILSLLGKDAGLFFLCFIALFFHYVL
jgi:hypothetical protein